MSRRRRRGRLLNGVFLLDKPTGMSSNHALQRARRLFNARKAGHTGTLDPFATGLLVCCFGQATKLSTQLLAADKTYIATMQLGMETTTGDLDGDPVHRISSEQVRENIQSQSIVSVLDQFVGQIKQIPPMHSALKKDGKPLYEYAREGIEVERPAREVTIYELKLLVQTESTLTILVSCSKGTYVRTLAEDIGRALGCYAYLTALRRTKIGPFDVSKAYSLRQLQYLIDAAKTTEQKENVFQRIDQWLFTGANLPTELLPVNF